MVKNEPTFRSSSAINRQMKQLKAKKEELLANATQDMSKRLTVKVARLLNGGNENPSIDELSKMALTTKAIHYNQEYNMLIEKAAAQLCKQLLKNKDARNFHKDFYSLASEIAAFIRDNNIRKGLKPWAVAT